jgi:hypothetical protein
MFHRHYKNIAEMPATAPGANVRVLHSHDELQAAVERAREFERRGAEEYERRVGTYDQFLRGREHLAEVVTMKSSGSNSLG